MESPLSTVNSSTSSSSDRAPTLDDLAEYTVGSHNGVFAVLMILVMFGTHSECLQMFTSTLSHAVEL